MKKILIITAIAAVSVGLAAPAVANFIGPGRVIIGTGIYLESADAAFRSMLVRNLSVAGGLILMVSLIAWAISASWLWRWSLLRPRWPWFPGAAMRPHYMVWPQGWVSSRLSFSRPAPPLWPIRSRQLIWALPWDWLVRWTIWVKS